MSSTVLGADNIKVNNPALEGFPGVRSKQSCEDGSRRYVCAGSSEHSRTVSSMKGAKTGFTDESP